MHLPAQLQQTSMRPQVQQQQLQPARDPVAEQAAVAQAQTEQRQRQQQLHQQQQLLPLGLPTPTVTDAGQAQALLQNPAAPQALISSAQLR